MADAEEKEKAEKLAAAKKRFEQLKKQKAGAKKGGAKKKEAKAEDSASKADDSAEKADAEVDADAEVEAEAKPEQVVEDVATDDVPETTTAEAEDKPEDSSVATEGTATTATPSLTIQSRQRSESFRQGAGELRSPGAKTSTLAPIDSESEVQEVYRKQAARIEELEKQVESLNKTQDKLSKAEEELEHLRESSGEINALKTKAALADERANEIETLKADLSSTQRQLTQAQQASSKARRASTASPSQELTEQLASKTSTIESLELELSNLRYQISSLEADKSSLDNKLAELETRAVKAEAASKSAQEETEKLQATLATAPAVPEATPTVDVEGLQSQLAALQLELKTSQASHDAATNKATNLETKIDTLTKLHRDSSTQNAAREKETKDLKSRIKSLSTAQHDAAGEDLSDLEDEERSKLHARIRDLEAETFELRRGVWRDKRTALQPDMTHDEAISSPPSGSRYEDVDLNGSYFGTPYAAKTAAARGSFGAGARQTSTFSDVLQSGIAAFTGRENPRAHVPGKSVDLLDDDFDEDAFRLARENEASARIERVKEVKRGLDRWRGWRLDLVEQRRAGVPGFATGQVFDA